jgi:hypothetical protein
MLAALVFLILPLGRSLADPPFHYPEEVHGKGSLRYINKIPVVIVEGKSEEIGEQMAVLTAKPARPLLNYPKDALKSLNLAAAWPVVLLTCKTLFPQFPPSYRCELETGARITGLDKDLLIVANTLFDIKKMCSCATLSVDAARNTTGGPLLGRNLDFPTLGYLHKYSVVFVVRPDGKHAFASVGFPGLLGCLSGMNEAGLAVAVLEVSSCKDGSPRLDSQGVPYALCIRRVLEECSTIDEAEKLLRSVRRTTFFNLAVCDRQGAAVFEITTKNIFVRRPVDGICCCTNHFRSPDLATVLTCNRYSALEQCRATPLLGLQDIAQRLHAANQGELTLQTMVFQPRELKLHLAIGQCPSSALPLRTLELAPLLRGERASRDSAAPGRTTGG